MLEYNGIKAAIPQDWLKILRESTADSQYDFKVDLLRKKNGVVAIIYKAITVNHVLIHNRFMYWSQKLPRMLEFDAFNEAFQRVYETTTNNKLRSFQL